jgi:hypothetical protein
MVSVLHAAAGGTAGECAVPGQEFLPVVGRAGIVVRRVRVPGWDSGFEAQSSILVGTVLLSASAAAASATAAAAPLADILLAVQRGFPADRALPGVIAEFRKKLLLPEAFARKAAQRVPAVFTVHARSPAGRLLDPASF